MKLSFINIIKNLLRRWYILVLALAIGVGAGCYSAFNATTQTEYVAQVYIDQNFEVKNPEPGVNYPDSVGTLTVSLINNSIMAIKNTNYLYSVCVQNGVETTHIDFNTAVKVSKVSENIVQISVNLNNPEKSKLVCEKIISGLSVHLNSSILNNIDPTTGTFVVGTPESNKIVVTEFMQPTKYVADGVSNIVKIAIYAIASLCVAILALVVIDLIKNKVNGANSVRCIFDIPTDDAKNINEGVQLCLAGSLAQNQTNKVFAFCCGGFETQEFIGAIIDNTSNSRVLICKVEKGKHSTNPEIEKKTDNVDELIISNGSLSGVEKILSVVGAENDYKKVIIIVENAIDGENAQLYAKIADCVFVALKNKKDNLWNLQSLIGKLNDNEIKVARIICV